MKKNITLIASLLLVTSAAFGQAGLSPSRKAIALPSGHSVAEPKTTEKAGGDLIWESDFSNPADWTIATAGQGTFEIGTNFGTGAQYLGAMASTSAGNGYAFFNGVQYLLASPAVVAPQSTTITSPAMDLTGISSISVSFEQRYRSFNFDLQFVEFSADGGATWTASEGINTQYIVNTPSPSLQNTLTLSFPTNGATSGMVRFRWDCNSSDPQFGSGYGWCIDDVKITEGYGNNIEVVSTYSSIGDLGYKYTKFPASQAGTAKMQFEAVTKNKGFNDQQLALNVTTPGYDKTGSKITVAGFESDTIRVLAADGYSIPTLTGAVDFRLEAKSDSTLEATSDDFLNVPFEVTPFIMAVDNYDGTPGSLTGAYGGTSTQQPNDKFGVCTPFEVFKDGEISGLQVGIANVSAANQNTYNGMELTAVLLRANATEYEFVKETDPYSIGAANYGNLVLFTFEESVPVFTGDDLLVCATSYVGSVANRGGVPIALSGKVKNANHIAVTGELPDNLGTFTPNADGMQQAPVIRIDFQSYAGLKEGTPVKELSVAPNPFNATTAINVDLKAEATVGVVVTDLSGRVVSVVAAEKMTAGTHAISINGADFSAGVYNCAISINNEVITKKIVKK